MKDKLVNGQKAVEKGVEIVTEENKKQKPKSNYIFPNFLAKAMQKVDLRTQYEASMMSMTFMAFGLVLTAVYLSIYVNFKLWYKIFLVLNCLAGLLFMISYVTTTFQQYKNYMEIIEFQNKNLVERDGNKKS